VAVDLSMKLDSVAPSLQRHYSTFITTARNSAPVPRIGTLVLMGLPLGRLPSHRGDRFPRSAQEPEPRSRRLHAGRHLGSRQVSPRLVPGERNTPGFDAIYALFDTSSAVRLRSSPWISPDRISSGLFLNAHHHRSLRQQLEVV